MGEYIVFGETGPGWMHQLFKMPRTSGTTSSMSLTRSKLRTGLDMETSCHGRELDPAGRVMVLVMVVFPSVLLPSGKLT